VSIAVSIANSSEAFVIAVDAGGTFTRVACFGLDGSLLSANKGRGGSPTHNDDAAQNIRNSLTEAFDSGGLNPKRAVGLAEMGLPRRLLFHFGSRFMRFGRRQPLPLGFRPAVAVALPNTAGGFAHARRRSSDRIDIVRSTRRIRPILRVDGTMLTHRGRLRFGLPAGASDTPPNGRQTLTIVDQVPSDKFGPICPLNVLDQRDSGVDQGAVTTFCLICR